MTIIAIYALNSLFYAAVLFLISAGINMIFGVMRIVNLSHGSLFGFGAYVAASALLAVSKDLSGPLLPLLYVVPVAGAAIVGLIGLIMEPTIIRPMYARAPEYQLLMTFGGLLVLEDAVILLWGPFPLRIPELYEALGRAPIFGFLYPNYNLLVIVVGFLAAIGLWLLVYRTKFGVMVRATSLDREMATALGVNVRRLYMISFAIGAMLAGLAGAYIVPTSAAIPGMGIDALALAFVVMVVGGLGSLKGAFVGALIVGVVRSIGIAFFPEIELALLWLVAAIVLIIRPTGLFGRE